jgi:phosphomevalonate kinase
MVSASVVLAPGKMLLTGSYAVLRGAPALVVAIDRHAVAGGSSSGPPIAEVLAAFDGEKAPPVDVSSLQRDSRKLGLGGSAAAVVAALGHREDARGRDLASATVRRAIFDAARRAHARVQGGGSGVDVAASVYGGVLRYALDPGGDASITPVRLPEGLTIDAYASGRSARTSEMRARVDALEARDGPTFRARMDALAAAASAAVSAVQRGDARAFLEAARSSEHALSALGRDADAPIVLPEAEALAVLAEGDGGAFLPSGAGGGDVFVRLGLAPKAEPFESRARAAGFERLDLRIDLLGVRVTRGLEGPFA